MRVRREDFRPALKTLYRVAAKYRCASIVVGAAGIAVHRDGWRFAKLHSKGGEMRAHFLMTTAAMALLAALSAPAQAQSIWISPFAGNWTNPTNWSPGFEPTAADDAVNNRGSTMLVTTSGDTANSLTLGQSVGSGGTLAISAGGVLTTNGSNVIGLFGAGTLNLSAGGDFNFGTGLVLGSGATGSGTVTIDGAGSRLFGTGSVIVGLQSVGTLAVQNGGTLSDFGGFVGNLAGSQGTVTVSGVGSTWTNTDTIQVGALGTGTVTVENGGTLNSGGGGSVGLSAGSTGTVTVTGPGSSWINGPAGGLNIGSFGTGTLTIANGGMVINNTAFVANIGLGAGSQGTVTVTGPGSMWTNSSGVNIGNLGTGTLTIANGGIVTAPTVVIASNAGSIGTLNIGAGAGNAGPGTLNAPSVAFGAGIGTINFNHTSTNYVFAPAISGNGTVNVLAGTTTLTGANTYSGATNVNAGTLAGRRAEHVQPKFGGDGCERRNARSPWLQPDRAQRHQCRPGEHGHGHSAGHGLDDDQLHGKWRHHRAEHVSWRRWLAIGQARHQRRHCHGQHECAGDQRGRPRRGDAGEWHPGGAGDQWRHDGAQRLRARWRTARRLLRLSSVPWRPRPQHQSQRLVPALRLRPRADRSVDAARAARADRSVAARQSVGAARADRSLAAIRPAAEPAAARRRVSDHRARTRNLWGGAASCAPIGAQILGTLDDRMGDTYEPDGCAVAPAVASAAAETSAVDLPTKKPAAVPTKKPGPAPCPLFSPSVWGRFFGQTIHNHYQAFADPSASGNLGGFQGGIDLLRGSLIAGQYERAGLYGAYGDVHADVNGLVTNSAATAYVLTHTGSMNLNSWSAGGYWTHVGPGGWYLDAVLQGTWYYGSASTQFARLNTDGTGFIASLEGGYPYAWPQLGPGFVIEPQGQILWQKVSFRHDYDGLGDVALGDTTGPSGRIGLRTKWTIVTAGGQVWQPYLRGNLWRDWGAEANAVYSGTDIVPLVSQVTRLELGGGLTGRINAAVSVFANVDYEFAVGAAENEKRNGVRGAFGARYTW